VLGFAVPQFGGSAHLDVGELARFASTAEQLGADSLWVGDRLLAAVNPTVGYVGTDTVPEQFRTNLDPFIALTVAATVTTTAQLGSSVFVAPWYPPVPLARQLTSIDVISGGRLLAGFGIGWSPEEYQAAGAPFRRRGAQLDELLDALDALWTVNPVRLDGERWSIPESWVNLKPVQRPRPPVYLGAFNPAGLKRVGERADGWMPGVKVPGGVSLDMLRWQRQTIADAARAAGRNPSAIHAYVRVNVAEGTPVDKVTDALQVLADNGYPDAFVDLMYVATGTGACLEWVKRLLPQ
jgi:probable F420-dependent oxidoreductase